MRISSRIVGAPAEINFDLARRWNDVLAAEDLVYHLGDFAMGDPDGWPQYRAALNGRIVFVRGNHDVKIDRVLARAAVTGKH